MLCNLHGVVDALVLTSIPSPKPQQRRGNCCAGVLALGSVAVIVLQVTDEGMQCTLRYGIKWSESNRRTVTYIALPRFSFAMALLPLASISQRVNFERFPLAEVHAA